MMVASFTLAKVLGLVYILPLNRIIGNQGLGIYSSAYSLYLIFNTLSTSGFPTAMAKLIAEKLALRRYGDVEQMYRVTMRLVFIFGLILFFAMWFGAPLYSRLSILHGSPAAVSAVTMSIRALSFSLLVVPLESGLRGYLQGFQELEPSAWSQSLEQLVRVIAIVVGAYLVVHNGGSIAAGAAAATFGAFVGGVGGLVLLVSAVVPLRRSFLRRHRRVRPSLSPGQTVRALYQIGFPVSVGNLVLPISSLVDNLTVPNLLMMAGYTVVTAQAAYGILSRQAVQLIQLPLAFAGAIGASILPAVAEAAALRDQAAMHSRVTGTIRSTMFMTLPVAAALLVLGKPVERLLSGNTDGSVIISSVCFMGIFSSLELISTYILQGLGKMYRPVRNMFLGVAVKLAMNLLLIPHWHILGAAIGTTVGYLCSSTLNVLAVKKYGQLQFSVWGLSAKSIGATLPVCAVLAAGSWVGYHLAEWMGHDPTFVAAVQFVVAIALGGVAYVVLSISLGAVTGPELRRIPFVGPRLARFAPNS
ncbi:MAG: polysaccharide biosynthesis protein [Alicyclobacillus sp.]|nr:polysaccharide biosynthesis protein [Alicyclobacillus sp.]